MTPDGWTQAIHWTTFAGASLIVVGSFRQALQNLRLFSDLTDLLELPKYAQLYGKIYKLIYGGKWWRILTPVYSYDMIRKLPALLEIYLNMLKVPQQNAAKIAAVDEVTKERLDERSRVFGAWLFILLGSLFALAGTVIQIVLDYT